MSGPVRKKSCHSRTRSRKAPSTAARSPPVNRMPASRRRRERRRPRASRSSHAPGGPPRRPSRRAPSASSPAEVANSSWSMTTTASSPTAARPPRSRARAAHRHARGRTLRRNGIPPLIRQVRLDTLIRVLYHSHSNSRESGATVIWNTSTPGLASPTRRRARLRGDHPASSRRRPPATASTSSSPTPPRASRAAPSRPGLPADVVAFSLEPDMTRLVDAGLVAPTGTRTSTRAWSPTRSSSSSSARATRRTSRPGTTSSSEGIEVITPNPFTSGGAQWNIMAAYGAQLEQGKTDEEAIEYLRQLFTTTSRAGQERARGAADVRRRQGRRPPRLRERGDLRQARRASRSSTSCPTRRS